MDKIMIYWIIAISCAVVAVLGVAAMFYGVYSMHKKNSIDIDYIIACIIWSISIAATGYVSYTFFTKVLPC